MAFRPESRWWIVTLAIVAVLIAISMLAMDRPNVVWSAGAPQCPACRSGVELYSSRCATCTTPFDWVIADPESCPLCPHDLSALEAEEVHDLVKRLGDEEATARIATSLEVTPASARAYLATLGRGRCGWCGGRGVAPAAAGATEATCPICAGRGACIGCAGNRRVQLGLQAAARALQVYRAEVKDLDRGLPEAVRREELGRLARAFLDKHAGSLEAAQVVVPDNGGEEPAVARARKRLETVLAALRR